MFPRSPGGSISQPQLVGFGIFAAVLTCSMIYMASTNLKKLGEVTKQVKEEEEEEEKEPTQEKKERDGRPSLLSDTEGSKKRIHSIRRIVSRQKSTRRQSMEAQAFELSKDFSSGNIKTTTTPPPQSSVEVIQEEEEEAAKKENTKRSKAVNKVLSSGFVEQNITLHNKEVVGYFERPAAPSEDDDAVPLSTCIILHGMFSDALSIVPFGIALNLPTNVRIIIPDAPGHGSRKDWAEEERDPSTSTSTSDRWPGFDIMYHTDDLAELMSLLHVNSTEPIDIVGYSMGGATAFYFASVRFPRIRRLVLLSPAVIHGYDLLEPTVMEQQHLCFGYGQDADTAIQEAEEYAILMGFPIKVANAISKSLVTKRCPDAMGEGRYWSEIWRGFINHSNDTDAYMLRKRKLAHIAATGKRLKGLPVLVIQGTDDKVTGSDAPALIQGAVGSSSCEVELLLGFGHYADPEGGSGDVYAAASDYAGDFLKSSGSDHDTAKTQ